MGTNIPTQPYAHWERGSICETCVYFDNMCKTCIRGMIAFPRNNCPKFIMKHKDSCEKHSSVNGNVEDADVVIVYGNVNGSIKKCKTVVVINGNVNGDVKNNETVAGYFADKSIGKNALWEKAGSSASITRKDIGIEEHRW